MSYQAPTVDTHVPLTTSLPEESNTLAVGRPDIPPPSLWQHSVRVTHKVTKKQAVVVRVDWNTNQFRAFYPDEVGPNGEMGRFAERTEWEQCRDWEVDVTFSPRELERQAARALLEEEIAKLDAKQIALAKVLCDDPDPNKALGKFQLLVSAGLIHLPAVSDAAVAEAVKPDHAEQNATNARGKK
jgi:hypothetical protein